MDDPARLEFAGRARRIAAAAWPGGGDFVSCEREAWDSAALRSAAATNLEGKQRIGRRVAQQIPSGAHIALSGGSTTLEVARALKALRFQVK